MSGRRRPPQRRDIDRPFFGVPGVKQTVVPGIGDKAAIVQNTGLLVLKGSSLLSVSISGGADMSEDEVIEASKQIAALAAGRM